MANENWKKLDPIKRERMEAALKSAQACQRATGVLTSITMAQWAIESGWGEHHMGRANNYFGIKAGDNWRGPVTVKETREYIRGKWITVNAAFRAYKNIEESFVDHGKFLLKERYKPCFQYPAGTKDSDRYKWFVQKVWECGYATDNMYVSKLINAIEKYGWQHYDIPEEEIRKGLNRKL